MQKQTLVWIFIALLVLLSAVILMNRPVPQDGNGSPLPTTTENGDASPEPSTEITYTNATADDITVELPFPGAVTGKEFSVIGKARGPWFFEASFPVEVLDENGTSLSIGIAQAEGEWMTTEFVPFKADITVPPTYIGKATLVLHRDNPSGLPEHDASVSFPITIEY